jgi:hypothetical protein
MFIMLIVGNASTAFTKPSAAFAHIHHAAINMNT